ncbi:hypothetical protein SAMN05421823_108297 [Catalinimonas alkaloidigena]|uniref:Phosphoribosylpyrophosphate synthetase n=1 Tax=Catalinimonas alkaloidigena TaxID=1075417 RepID=A0A1G9NHZ4_9BACT|nr:phosphoribosylpyrophosphate synthetase [Catalinimonas alkaloidigena]SDL85943.1 hypothetical protein SAMN05421823_108297 [Catalinimonas alkaloidigena]
MYDYTTLSEAISGLQERGYTYDFNLRPDCLHCPELDRQLSPDEFTITETYRFEGMSNPDDNAVVYGIASNDGLKGTFVDAYGTYADTVSEQMIQKLNFRR